MPRKFSKPVMIMYAFGTGTASDQAVLVAAATFKNGLSGIWYQWLWLFATPFYWIIAPIMRRFRAITTADVYELRYDRGVARLFAAFGIASLSVKTGLLLKGSAVLLEGCTDGRMDTNLVMLAMSVLFVTYGTVGGLTSVILTDFIQGLLTLLFSFMLLPLVMGEVGGMEGIRRTIQDPRMFSLVAPGKIGVLFIVMIGVQALVGIVAQPFVMGTCSAGKTEIDGRVGFMVGNFVKRICTIGWALTAIAALAWYVRRGVETEGINPDRVYGELARSLLPGVAPGFLGLFIAAMLASVMSSCSAYMITSSALFTENLYRPMVPGRSSSHYIGASRVASVLIVAGGLGFAYWLPSLVKGLEIWLSIAPMMGIAFWMGLFWRRTTVAGAWASAIAGFVVWSLAVQAPVIDWAGGLPYADALRLVWHESGRAPEIYEPWRIIAYMSAGIAAGVGVSLVTRPRGPGEAGSLLRAGPDARTARGAGGDAVHAAARDGRAAATDAVDVLRAGGADAVEDVAPRLRGRVGDGRPPARGVRLVREGLTPIGACRWAIQGIRRSMMTSRRAFLKEGGAGVLGASVLERAGAAFGAGGSGETVVVGAIGCGGRGTAIAQEFAKLKGVEVAYVCDPDEARAGAAAKAIAKLGGATPKVVTDLRRVLDDKSIDAVTVATPDHWHAPAAILACDAGKHVYVEKPCSHNIREGRLMVEAARRTGRVVQLGTQSRSSGLVAHAIAQAPRGADRRRAGGQGLEHPAPAGHRPRVARRAAGRLRLRPLARPRAVRPVPGQPPSLRLALVVRLRHRRHGQRRRPRPRHRPLGPRRRHPSHDDRGGGGQVLLRRRPAVPRHPVCPLRIPRRRQGRQPATAHLRAADLVALRAGGLREREHLLRHGRLDDPEQEGPREGLRRGRTPRARCRASRRRCWATRRTSWTPSATAVRPPPRSGSATSRRRCATWGTSRPGSGGACASTPPTERIVGDDEAASLARRSYREGHWAVPKGA